jgi:hypothetical protein
MRNQHSRLAVTLILILAGGGLSASAQLRPQVTQKPQKTTPAKPAQIVIETEPNAYVYLDDAFKGQASPQGRLVIENPKSGEHALRVSLAGKKEFERQVTVVAGQVTEVQAKLVDFAGPAKPTQIVVETDPNAYVYLDETFKGQTSPRGRLVIENLKPGKHGLRISAPGKKNYEDQVTVVAGQVTRVQETLPYLVGSIHVEASPGAVVFLDNSPRGVADATGQLIISYATAGPHRLRVSLAGKKDYFQDVTVATGQTVTTEVKWAATGGTVMVRSSPGAEVLIDGSNRGTVNGNGLLLITDVSAGAHELTVRAQGKRDYMRYVTVSTGEQATVDAPLADRAVEPPIRTSPGIEDAEAHFHRGEVLLSGHDVDGAITEYRAALRLKPDYILAHSSLGNALRAKGDLDGAIAEYREVVRLEPGDPAAQLVLSDALKRKGGEAASRPTQERGQGAGTGTSAAGQGSATFSVRHYHGAISLFMEYGTLEVDGERVRYQCAKDKHDEFDVPLSGVQDVSVSYGKNPYSVGFLDRMVTLRLENGRKYSFVTDNPEAIRSAILAARPKH